MSLVINDYEAYTLVKDHLLNQNEPSKDTNEDCQYRGYLSSTLADVMNEAGDNIDQTIDDDYVAVYEEMYELLANIPFNAKCAVGALITDDFYNEQFEGRTIERSCSVWDAVRLSNPLWKMTDGSYEMLRELQSIHDTNQPEDWEYKLLKMNDKFDKWDDYINEVTE